MKTIRIVVGVLLIGLILALFTAPLGPIPGIFISGEPTPVPTQWYETSNIQEIHLQTGVGPIGHTVIIWMVQLDGDLHVLGAKDSVWTHTIGEGGPVRIHMGDALYQLQATLLTSAKERVLAAWIAKYKTDYPEIVQGYSELTDAVETFAIFKLTSSRP